MNIIELFFSGYNITYFDGCYIYSGTKKIGRFDGAFIYALNTLGDTRVGDYDGDLSGGLLYHAGKLVGNFDGKYFYVINNSTAIGEYQGDENGGPIICYEYTHLNSKKMIKDQSNNEKENLSLSMIQKIKNDKRMRKKYF